MENLNTNWWTSASDDNYYNDPLTFNKLFASVEKCKGLSMENSMAIGRPETIRDITEKIPLADKPTNLFLGSFIPGFWLFPSTAIPTSEPSKWRGEQLEEMWQLERIQEDERERLFLINGNFNYSVY